MTGKKDLSMLCVLITLFLFAAAISGCSSSGSDNAGIFDNDAGNHPTNWTSSHTFFALPDAGNCTPCHGDELNGGISLVSCMVSECHHDTVPDWSFSSEPSVSPEHGTSAKRAPGSSGFISCQICHGTDFAGGLSGQDCFTCHPGSPHPNNWLTGDTLDHTTTAPENASVCALCHLGGGSFTITPPTPVPAGVTPGCFNSTLCHGADVGHPEGWAQPTEHGPAAKSPPGSSNGFSYCQDCHGTDFTGDIGDSCMNNSACHGAGVQSPHPQNWLPGDTFVHTTADEGNAPVCGLCHLGGGSLTITPPTPVPTDVTPGCFNATLCHGGEVSHGIPFLNHPQQAESSFDTNCVDCHAESGTSPVSGAPTCVTCHQEGSPITLTNCTSCHAEPPDGPAGPYPNIEGGHTVHAGLDSTGTPVDCATCHSGLESGSQNHYERANARTGSDALRVEPGDVAFNNLYNALAGPANFDDALTALDCANVRCHGGNTTPNWRTGSIDTTVDTGNSSDGCRACHTPGGTEPNSPVSGRHDKHLFNLGASGNALCTECHDMQNGTTGANNHFASLNTDTLEGPVGDTVEPNGDPGAYNAADKTCTVTCHGQIHTNFAWEGPAAPHALGAEWTVPNQNFHGLTAKQDLVFCQTCHGTPGTINFDGGITGTSCSACHPQAGAHPIRWFEAPETGFPPYTASHRNSGNRAVACAICHSVDGPGDGPDPGAPSCFSDSFNSASCHLNGPGSPDHSVPNLDATHTGATETSFGDNCSDCHATTGVSPVSSAPVCDSCHTNFAASSPLTNKDCTSCHNAPPDGGTYPNITGRHDPHNALPGVTGNCATCHTGLESGTQAHYDRAKSQDAPGDVNIAGTFDAQSGGSAFSAGAFTCTDVSCHGGQTTPSWRTGTINVNSDCLSCHERGNNQFNSYDSGEHGKHENEIPAEFPGIDPFCVACHDTAKLAAHHFTNLDTPAMEGPASGTIGGGSTFVNSYDPGSQSCTPSCHETESWD